MKFYAGIGSRKTPSTMLLRMENYAKYLQSIGYTLRSGGASGADQAFERGAGSNSIIYTAEDATRLSPSVYQRAFQIVKKVHPNPDALAGYSLNLHIRNVLQVIGDGESKSPVDFVICWAPPTSDRVHVIGGTNTAVTTARLMGIPVFNLAVNDSLPILNRDYTIISRCHISKGGLDTSVKSACLELSKFAPSWDMVTAWKRGDLSEEEYTKQYLPILDRAGDAWKNLNKGGEVYISCYCKDTDFCHTKLIALYGATRWPYIFRNNTQPLSKEIKSLILSHIVRLNWKYPKPPPLNSF